jgi:zinc transporter ZupT
MNAIIIGILLPAAIGFLAGIAFLLLIDELTPHLHNGALSALPSASC